MSDNKKYYWLKLKKDFFKRHDIQIIEAMANGKDYILFYLKMLVESVDHEGDLRFSDTIPYNDSMLSTITNTNVDIVRSAMKVFTELRMIEVLDNQTIHMAEVQKMLGKETYWAEQKRKQRVGQCPTNVQLVQPLSKQEIEIEIEIEKELEIEIKKEVRKKSNHKTLIVSPTSRLDFALNDFIGFRKDIKSPLTEKAYDLLIHKLNELSKSEEEQIAILNQSIMNGWKGVFELKNKTGKKPQTIGDKVKEALSDEDFINFLNS